MKKQPGIAKRQAHNGSDNLAQQRLDTRILNPRSLEMTARRILCLIPQTRARRRAPARLSRRKEEEAAQGDENYQSQQTYE